MPVVNANTTDDELFDELENTATYESSASLPIAKRYRDALQVLLASPRRVSKSASKGGLKVDAYVEGLEARLAEVKQWIAANDIGTTGGGTAAISFNEFRS